MEVHLFDINTLPLAAGVIAALAHVLAGPDHLAAVIPIAVENFKKAYKIGIAWGLGHISGMLLIGLIYILSKQLFPIDFISSYSELLVGFVLIFIGLHAFYKIFKDTEHHSHVHLHKDEEPFIHSHEHHHEKEEHLHTHSTQKKKGVIAAFSIGTLHGFAGISHFVALLPAIGLKAQNQTVQYISGFAIGTILAMGLFALIVGKTAEKSLKKHKSNFYKGLRFAAGSFALLLGIFWIWFTF